MTKTPIANQVSRENVVDFAVGGRPTHAELELDATGRLAVDGDVEEGVATRQLGVYDEVRTDGQGRSAMNVCEGCKRGTNRRSDTIRSTQLCNVTDAMPRRSGEKETRYLRHDSAGGHEATSKRHCEMKRNESGVAG